MSKPSAAMIDHARKLFEQEFYLDTNAHAEVVRNGNEVVVTSTESGVAGRVTLWGDQTWPYLQVFSGDTVPQPERRRQGLAVEPMTCPPNALASGEGLIALESGASITGHWGIEVG